MHRLIQIVFLMIVMAANADAESYGDKVQSFASAMLDQMSGKLELIRNGEKLCSLGASSLRGLTVTKTSTTGKINGLEPGDQIASVDGEKATLANFGQIMSKFRQGDDLTIGILRNGTSAQLDAVCGDGNSDTEVFRRIFSGAAKRNWDDCISATYEAEQVLGGQTRPIMVFRQRCSEAKRCGTPRTCKAMTSEDGMLFYEVQKIILQEAIVADEIQGVQAGIVSQIKWLDDSGFPQQASLLKQQLQDATQVSQTVNSPILAPVDPASTEQEPASIVVLTLNNRKNSGTDADIEATTQAIVDGLIEQYDIAASRWEGISDVQKPGDLRPIAKKSGASYVAEGYYSKTGDRIDLSILLYDVRDKPYIIWSDQRLSGDDWARDGVTGKSVRVERELSWVIDEFTRMINRTIDDLESERPPPSGFEATREGSVVSESPDDFDERGGLLYLGDPSAPFTGKIKRWWPGGILRFEWTYVDGRLHGSYKEWQQNRWVKAEGNMVDGKREGTWFLRSGNRIDRYCYSNGSAARAVPEKACE